MDDGLYTEEVQRHIYAIKARLPSDFPLMTDEREIYGSGVADCIIIQVPVPYFDARPVEQRLAIAIELEKLRSLIEGTGIGCLIEKVTTTR